MSTLRITDEDRARYRADKERSLADLLPPPASESTAPEPITARPFGRREIAMVVAGLVVALAAIALMGRGGAQPVPPTVAPAMAPASTSVPATATLAPTAEPSPTAPPTATPEPPTAAPAVVYIEVAPACDPAINPLYSVQLDVFSDDRKPLGQVVGVSCDSQADAQSNADALAAELKAKP